METCSKLKENFDKSRWKQLLLSPEQSDARVKILLIVGLAAIAMIFLSDRIPTGTKAAAAEPTGYTTMDDDTYTAQLEARLTELISSVEGAGSTKVMVTLESGTEYVYARQQKTSSALSENADANGKTSRDEKQSGEENLILIDVNGGEEPLLLKEISPKVAGVVVVCGGADDVTVRQRIIDVVTTALGTSSNRVCVTLMG